jgi:hypothetical protein
MVVLAAALLLAACGAESQPGPDGTSTGGPVASGSIAPSPTAAGNGALIDFALPGPGAQRYPIRTDGSIGPAAPVPWESGPEAEATLLEGAVGSWALTSTSELPITDVSATTALQVRDVVTGALAHEVAAPGWCSGPDGADWTCLLLDRDRMVRTSGLDGDHEATLTISATEDGRTLAEYGPFPALAAVRATTSPDIVILISYVAGPAHTAAQLDVRTGVITPIGTLPINQPWQCVLGTDSILTADGTTLQVLGPADVAPVDVPELGSGGPGAMGCSADGRHLYVRTDWTAEPDQALVIDAIRLSDGTRTPAVATLPSPQSRCLVTR